MWHKLGCPCSHISQRQQGWAGSTATRIPGCNRLRSPPSGSDPIASTTPAFQQRWFEDGEGTLIDLVTLQELQTSGRTDVWPEVLARCDNPVFGKGVGAASLLSAVENEGFPEPHNEFLRVWCDTGLVGSLLFWGFLGLAMTRASSRYRTRAPWADGAALQAGTAIVLMSLTDNPLTTTLTFMVPMALFLGWSNSSEHDTLAQSLRRRPYRRSLPNP